MDLRIFTEPQQGASYDQLLTIATAAEENGFDAFFRSDHYLRMGDVSGLPGSTDAWLTLAGLARETTRIRLGTLVTPITFRLPGPLAISVAQVDAMSGGRVELGLGAGWYDAEHAAYAIPFPATGERFDRLEEQLTIITGLWAAPAGEPFSFDGDHYAVKDSPGLPKPVQRPGPPIIIGGSGPKRTPALTARFAAESNCGFGQVDDFVAGRDRVRKACEAIDRDPDSLVFSVALETVCGEDEAALEARASKLGRSLDRVRRQLGGTPSEVVDKLGAYRDAGATRAYLQLIDVDDLDHVRLLGEQVLPAVA
jgi:alkanesulfonate monooxygenase